MRPTNLQSEYIVCFIFNIIWYWFLFLKISFNAIWAAVPGGGGGGGGLQFSKSWPYFRPKNFIFHIHFQTWPQKSLPVFRPGLSEIMSSFLRWQRQQKRFLICIIISLSFLYIWNWNDKYVHTLPWFPQKPYLIPDQNAWAKFILI